MSEAMKPPMLTGTFWDFRGTRPMDQGGHLFFANGLDALGAAIFGDEWTGDEYRLAPPVDYSKGLPRRDGSTHSLAERWTLQALLHAHRPDLCIPTPPPPISPPRSLAGVDWATAGNAPSQSSLPQNLWSPTPAHIAAAWEVVDQLTRRDTAAAAPYFARANDLSRLVVRGCLDGDLRATFRSNGDGELYKVPSGWWGTENWASRFATCKIRWLDPFETGQRGFPANEPENSCWIFLHAEDVGRVSRMFAQARQKALAAQSAPPNEPWWPAIGAQLINWCTTPEAEAGAVAHCATDKPAESELSRALSMIWQSAARYDKTPKRKIGSAATIAQLRRDRSKGRK